MDQADVLPPRSSFRPALPAYSVRNVALRGGTGFSKVRILLRWNEKQQK